MMLFFVSREDIGLESKVCRSMATSIFFWLSFSGVIFSHLFTFNLDVALNVVIFLWAVQCSILISYSFCYFISFWWKSWSFTFIQISKQDLTMAILLILSVIMLVLVLFFLLSWFPIIFEVLCSYLAWFLCLYILCIHCRFYLHGYLKTFIKCLTITIMI